MAILPPKKGAKRRPSLRGNLLQDTTRGVERNRAWPEARGSRFTPEQLAQQEWFRQANFAFKLVAPESQTMFREAAANTSLYPRDIFTIMTSGRLFALVLDDGRMAYPMPAILAVSESLDAITQTPGATLVRGTDRWIARPPTPQTGVLESRITIDTAKAVPANGQLISWDSAQFDEIGVWNPATPTRLVIPASVTRITMGLNAASTSGTASTMGINVHQNGQIIASAAIPTGLLTTSLSICSGPLDVAEGDVFECYAYRSSAAARTWNTPTTAIWMRFG